MISALAGIESRLKERTGKTPVHFFNLRAVSFGWVLKGR